MIIYGINPVLEALRAGRVSAVSINAHGGARLNELAQLAEEQGIEVRRVDASILIQEARGGVHQGVVARVRAARRYRLDDLARDSHGPPLIVVLDGVEDPHNVGAILRTADAAGVSGLVRQTRRAASLDGIVAKASAGAVAHVKIVDVVNIARALDELKRAGVWTIGFADSAPLRYDEADLTTAVALVVGGEGTGLRRLVRETCDLLVSIPMRGHVQSLNVSVAAGIALFEAVRQRQAAGRLHGQT